MFCVVDFVKLPICACGIEASKCVVPRRPRARGSNRAGLEIREVRLDRIAGVSTLAVGDWPTVRRVYLIRLVKEVPVDVALPSTVPIAVDYLECVRRSSVQQLRVDLDLAINSINHPLEIGMWADVAPIVGCPTDLSIVRELARLGIKRVHDEEASMYGVDERRERDIADEDVTGVPVVMVVPGILAFVVLVRVSACCKR